MKLTAALAASLAASVVAHGAGGWLLLRAPRPVPVAPAPSVELVVAPPPTRPTPPRTAPPPPAAPPSGRSSPRSSPRSSARSSVPRARAVARPLVALASAPSSADAPAVEAPPASDAPLDFTDGPVLGGGAAGADAAGDEAAPRAAPVARPVRPAAANLARRPEPPALDEALQRRYPDEARVAGRAGAATVRVRISRDGRASVLAVASASEPAFGEACRATVDATRWRPPLDAEGIATSTDVIYRCRFEVAQP